MNNAVYIVTGDAGDLEGWTPETLASALESPLGELGVAVECRPKQFGDGGLWGCNDPLLRERVKLAVERVVVGD